MKKEYGAELRLVPAYTHKEELKMLFSEYTEMLIQGEEVFAKFLKMQNYDEELEHPERKYGEPEGRLYLAYKEDVLVGSVALRKLSDEHCEIKRLYIRPEFRRNHYAEFLVKRIIADAKEIGYSSIYLDTLPFLKGAIALYKKLGFVECEKYLNTPIESTIYLKLDL